MPKLTMSKSLVFLMLFFFVACESIFGILTVDEEITLQGNNSVAVIKPGNYAVEIDVERDYFDLKFESGKIDGNKYFRFDIGRDELPGENEILVVDANKAGQPYDLNIENTLDVVDSDTVEAAESCTGTEILERCRFINGRYTCTPEFVQYFGERDVIYLERTKTKTLTSSLLEEDATAVVASFKAETKETDKVYKFEGICLKN